MGEIVRIVLAGWMALLASGPVLAGQISPAGTTVSLFDGRTLGQWRVCDYIASGEVRVENGAIIIGKGYEQTGIVWTGPVLRNDYEISLEASRLEGHDFFCGLTFPVQESHCSLIVGGWYGKVVGLSNIDLMDAGENETTVLLTFEQGRWYPIRLRVTEERIQVWIEGDQVIDVPIKGRIIDTRTEVELCIPLGLMTWKTTGAIRDIQLTNLAVPPAGSSRGASDDPASRWPLSRPWWGGGCAPLIVQATGLPCPVFACGAAWTSVAGGCAVSAPYGPLMQWSRPPAAQP